jgi:hypothetical protein
MLYLQETGYISNLCKKKKKKSGVKDSKYLKKFQPKDIMDCRIGGLNKFVSSNFVKCQEYEHRPLQIVGKRIHQDSNPDLLGGKYIIDLTCGNIISHHKVLSISKI